MSASIGRPAGARARAHGHLERARHQAILVGRGTFDADAPRLDVRLPGLEDRGPKRLLLTRGKAPDGWTAEPLKKSGRHSHQIWLSPTGETAYGVIHFSLPLPVGPELGFVE